MCNSVRYEVLIAVAMKGSIFWDIMPYSPLKIYQLFGGTCRLHLHGRRICQARNQHETCSSTCYLLHAGFLPGLLFFDPEYGGDMFLGNVGCFQRTTERHIPEYTTDHSLPRFLRCLLQIKPEIPTKTYVESQNRPYCKNLNIHCMILFSS
jgi:hypothetical protein